MTNLRHNFNDLAAKQDGKKKYPPPFSLRLTYEERARLEALADGQPLGAYIREALLGDDVSPRKMQQNADFEALGRVLGALGQSRLSSNLNQLAKAVNTGTLPVTPEVEADLRRACEDVAAMRAELMRALGKKPGIESSSDAKAMEDGP